MHRTTLQRSSETARTSTGLVQRIGLVSMSDFAIVTHVEPRKGQDYIEFIAAPCKCSRIAGITHWIHRTVDEHDEMVADLVPILCFSQCIEQPFPFGHIWRRIGYLNLLKQSANLRAGQPLCGVSKNAAGRFQVLGTEWGNA